MKKLAFVCIHNSCRSQMAEGFAKELGKDVFEVYSAGTEEYPEIKPMAVEVMKEVGINLDSQYPKLLSDIPQEIDILITMGCGVECPYIPCNHREDWGLEDPSEGTIEDFRQCRNMIKEKMLDLIYRVENNFLEA